LRDPSLSPFTHGARSVGWVDPALDGALKPELTESQENANAFVLRQGLADIFSNADVDHPDISMQLASALRPEVRAF
jgi:hypothetical protein